MADTTRIHWLPEEVPLADDVKDWRQKLSEGERNLLTQIFRFFTQADVEVNKLLPQALFTSVRADRSENDVGRILEY